MSTMAKAPDTPKKGERVIRFRDSDCTVIRVRSDGAVLVRMDGGSPRALPCHFWLVDEDALPQPRPAEDAGGAG